jgi:hypothetical protein
MRFNLVDRILDFEPGKRIRLVKNRLSGRNTSLTTFPASR